MLAEERHAKILDILSRTGAVKTIQLAQLLGTSTETVRKDLLQLDRTGQIRRVHGGAVSAGEHSAPAYISFSDREPVHVAAKTAIARRAAQMVSEGQCVGLDSVIMVHETDIFPPRREKSGICVLRNSLVFSESEYAHPPVLFLQRTQRR